VAPGPNFENPHFTRMNMSGSKTNGNNKLTNLTNLTININRQRIQHDEAGDTWNLQSKTIFDYRVHTIQLGLPQFRDCVTYSAFRCTISSVKFSLTSRDLLIHRPMPKYLHISLYVSLDRAPNILKRALLRANCKECLIAELIGHASVQ